MQKALVLTPSLVFWDVFKRRLKHKLMIDIDGKEHIRCHHDFRYSTKALDSLIEVVAEDSLDLFKEFGATCDCEVLGYVEKNWFDAN